MDQGNEVFQNITIPLVSQFRFDFWRMRILANLGCFVAYRTGAQFSHILPETVKDSYKKKGYGIIGGGGLAYGARHSVPCDSSGNPRTGTVRADAGYDLRAVF